MRILWACPFFPYPPNTGIRIREYNLLVLLSQKHDITLLSLIQSDEEREYVKQMEKYCLEVVAILPDSQVPGALDGRRRLTDAVFGAVDKHPRRFYGRGSSNVVERVREFVSRGQFDLVLVETLFMSNYLWDVLSERSVRAVLVQHNVETLIQKQEFRVADGWFGKLRKWLYYISFVGFERKACLLYDGIAVVSEQERRTLLELVPQLQSRPVQVVPNGVDAALCSYRIGEVEDYSLIYPGSMTYSANLDAMEYFLSDIWSTVRLECPRAHLYITGKTDGVAIDKLPVQDGVTFTGYVDDIHALVAQSHVCIVPLRVGGGTRLKILEAMALGTPVVSTPKGAEGLDVEHGRNILIANEPQEFAGLLLDLLRDEPLRRALATNGRQLVRERYSWDRSARHLERLLDQVCVTDD